MLQNILLAKDEKAELISPRTIENGKLKLVPSKDWTSGFFAGQLWYLYEFTRDKKWKAKADSFTLLLEKEQFNASTHDMGFKMYNSYGIGYRLTKNAHYKAVIIQSAKTLATRFNKKTGTIRSWDHHADVWDFPVIIDNMMNLELLFAATRLTGDSLYYNIAVSHANATLKNHFRKDYSSYHVVDYDTITGNVKKKMTHQGFADESAWARGQGWALYGFTMCYRETKDKKYLHQADSIAAFILHHPNLPADGVPYWDFNDTAIPAVPRDASAAAVIASGLYQLSKFSKQSKEYKIAADKILTSLTNNYRSAIGENFGFILLHSTGNKPAKSEIDVPINYADYYYLEALLRSKK
ncbi:glycoside hydrolase family 88 protein [Ferruginibacter sp. SUN106]|uniref:glycoside hydrolase family 88 protein n=1 Tax=Ferruginibacter sp. SUN106 TaxID=2978348 RepID=UPI003D369BE0